VRIFKSDFLERLTLERWQSIFKFWVPVIFILIYLGNHHDDPFDPLRGVPAIIYILILYSFFYLLIPTKFLDVFLQAF
jgi:amino acid permease